MQLKSQTLNPPPGSLPARMRALFVSSESQDNRWLSEAFAADCASVVALEEAMGAEAALARLRDEVFDAIVLRHIPGLLDALELCEAIRELGVEEPVLVLGDDDAGDFATLVYEIGGDAYLCTPTTSTRTLLWTLSRAMERRTLMRENRRLVEGERYRLRHEQEDAVRLLADQRALIREQCHLTDDLKTHYRELLRTHVIMGAGNLREEIKSLALNLAGGQMSADAALGLHLETLEELIRGLGNRSARHVMARADLLALDLLSRLAESYRRP